VIAGADADDDAVARWAYAVRSAAGPVPISLYRRGGRAERLRSRGISVLSEVPSTAQRELFEMVFATQGMPLASDAARPRVAAARLRERREAVV
jgi:hypothetical protein